MEFLKKYWGFILLGLLVGIYFSFKAKIDKWLGIAKDQSSCKTGFYVKLPDGKTQSIVTTDEGTTGNPVPAYYKNDVTMTEQGITESGESIRITKEEFKDFCKYKYSPPYAWYTQSYQDAGTGHVGRTTKIYR